MLKSFHRFHRYLSKLSVWLDNDNEINALIAVKHHGNGLSNKTNRNVFIIAYNELTIYGMTNDANEVLCHRNRFAMAFPPLNRGVETSFKQLSGFNLFDISI